MVDGAVVEQGSYTELLQANGALAKLVAEHVSDSRKEAEMEEITEDKEAVELKAVHIADDIKEHAVEDKVEKKVLLDKGDTALMLKEEREIGAVSGAVYMDYIRR